MLRFALLLMFSCSTLFTSPLLACSPPTNADYSSGHYSGRHRNKISHGFLVEQALKLLKSDPSNSRAQSSFLTTLWTRRKDIQVGSDMPDIDETFPVAFVPTMKGHFYHHQSKRNYMGQTSPTAMTEFLRHNALAETAMQTQDWSTYLNEIGRATHYLSDACVPFHATNRIAGLSWHSAYEDFVNDILRNEPESLEATSYQDFDHESFADLLDRCANTAAAVASDADASDFDFEGNPIPHYARWTQAARAHVPYTQVILAAYLRKSMLRLSVSE